MVLDQQGNLGSKEREEKAATPTANLVFLALRVRKASKDLSVSRYS